MKFQFVRLQEDGRIGSITPLRTFDSAEEAKIAGPDFLATRRGGGAIVLIQILEVAHTTSNVRYQNIDQYLTELKRSRSPVVKR